MRIGYFFVSQAADPREPGQAGAWQRTGRVRSIMRAHDAHEGPQADRR
jgi:hypothetical protein